MKTEILTKAVELAGKIGHVLVATVGADGMPHIAAAGQVAQAAGRLEVTAWFCPVTVVNLQGSPTVAVVVWDPGRDLGYQLLGRAEEVSEVAQLDGYLPALEEHHPQPQVERKLVIKVERILDFRHAPHSDSEL